MTESLDALMGEVADLMPGAVMVEDLTNSGRAALARIEVDGATYVAKRHETTEAFGNEVEALRTLPPDVRPALISVGQRVVVMEDLGPGESLADLLLGDDPARAREGLLLWATTLGCALRPTMREGQRAKPLDLADEVAALATLADHFDVAAPTALGDDVSRLVAPLNASSPWWAFGPSDACPDNNRVMADGSMTLFDFEGATWRHAASEAAYTIGPFCSCWCVAHLPDGMTDAMYAAFEAALEPEDPAEFRVAAEMASLVYVLQQANWYRYFLKENAPIGPPGRAPATGRQFVPFRLDRVAGYRDRYPALGSFAANLADAIRQRWPDTPPMPLYPAFRSG